MDFSGSIYEKPGHILLVQTDHISGEVIGTVIADFYQAGAFNVQVIPTITKKNRPGHLFVIDTAADNSLIENLIINELGATGWHLIKTGHRHVATEIISRDVTFQLPDGPQSFNVKIKVIKKQPDSIRPEHASCLAVREALREKGIHMSLAKIRQQIVMQASNEGIKPLEK